MVKILDTTLREGEQTPGVYFDVHIKIAIADMLADMGIDIIEAGHPAVTEEIHQAVRQLSRRGLPTIIGAHARSQKEDIDLAIEAGVRFLGLFYCVSRERLAHHQISLNDAIDHIVAMIRYAREKNPLLLIRYTPEDTVRSPFNHVVEAASAAAAAGADIISIADTTGYMIPGTDRSMYGYVSRLRDALTKKNLTPALAVHCHNDRGLALANAIDGFRAGADIIDASVLGLGERAGIVDLASLLAVLIQDFQEPCRWKTEKVNDLYQLVSRYSGIPIPTCFPVTGANAFTHCAGVHTQAALVNPLHYQSMPPELFGRRAKIALDHMSGLSSLRYSLNQIGETSASDDFSNEVLKKVKEVGQTGRTVDLNELTYIVRYLRQGWLKN